MRSGNIHNAVMGVYNTKTDIGLYPQLCTSTIEKCVLRCKICNSAGESFHVMNTEKKHKNKGVQPKLVHNPIPVLAAIYAGAKTESKSSARISQSKHRKIYRVRALVFGMNSHNALHISQEKRARRTGAEQEEQLRARATEPERKQ